MLNIPLLQKLMTNERSHFLGKGSVHSLFQISIELWFYVTLHASSRVSLKLLVVHTSGGISCSPGAILFFNLFWTASSLSSG